MICLEHFAPVVAGSGLYQGINVQVRPGQILPVMGASGSGKTSLLNALRGQLPHVGSVSVSRQDIFSVFQHHDQLFPWFTNQHNLDLVCHRPYRPLAHKWSVDQLLERYPSEISVGQRQRLVLLRGVCSGRPVLLCDEPLSAVDDLTAVAIARDFQDLVAQSGIACVWVTHNLIEARILAPQVMVIDAGQARMVESRELENIFCPSV